MRSRRGWRQAYTKLFSGFPQSLRIYPSKHDIRWISDHVVLEPLIFVRSPFILIQILPGQMGMPSRWGCRQGVKGNSVATELPLTASPSTVPWGWRPTHWHLETGGVVVIVELVGRDRVSLTNIQLLEILDTFTSLHDREPIKDVSTWSDPMLPWHLST